MIAYLKNWKTNLSAFLVFCLVGLRLLKLIDNDTMITILSVLVTYGFIVTKDASRKDLNNSSN